MEATNLAVFWASVIALSIIIYVVLDGFDLGVGVLFGFTRDETTACRCSTPSRRSGTATKRGW